MTTAELVNLIVRKFGGNRVTFLCVERNDFGYAHVDFVLGGNKYRANYSTDKKRVYVWHSSPAALVFDDYSRWVEGVLNGMVRNEEGELVKQ